MARYVMMEGTLFAPGLPPTDPNQRKPSDMTNTSTPGGWRIGVAGATGAVVREMLKQLETCPWPIAELRALASARSAGKTLPFGPQTLTVQELTPASLQGLDVVLFSAGGSTSRKFAPVAAEAGALVIDNSSAFRMEDEVPLVVPEVNFEAALDALQSRGGCGIVANPNCSTIQMVVALWPLHQAVPMQRVIVSTYQSVSGAGASGMTELEESTRAMVQGQTEPKPVKFAHPIAFNALPHIDVFVEHDYTREERKMTLETRKIMSLPQLQISATCVRVPVMRSHSEAVTVDFASALSAQRAREILKLAPGITVLDKPTEALYPTARQAEHQDDTFVGRIREDPDRDATLHLWIVSDNLRKGAATNAIQIMNKLLEGQHLVPSP